MSNRNSSLSIKAQLISSYKNTVYNSASKLAEKEMASFVCRFNDMTPQGKTVLPALTRAQALPSIFSHCTFVKVGNLTPSWSR